MIKGCRMKWFQPFMERCWNFAWNIKESMEMSLRSYEWDEQCKWKDNENEEREKEWKSGENERDEDDPVRVINVVWQ